MSYQESLNQVRVKSEEELRDLQEAIKNAVTIFEMKTGMTVISIKPTILDAVACASHEQQTGVIWRCKLRFP